MIYLSSFLSQSPPTRESESPLPERESESPWRTALEAYDFDEQVSWRFDLRTANTISFERSH